MNSKTMTRTTASVSLLAGSLLLLGCAASSSPARQAAASSAHRGEARARVAYAPAAPASIAAGDRAPAAEPVGRTAAAPEPTARTESSLSPPPSPAERAPAPEASSAEARQQRPPAGILTAASVGDVDRFENYLSYLNRHGRERSQLGLRMERRVRFRVIDRIGRPVNDARVEVKLAGGLRVEGRTHADGYWDFFPAVSARQSSGQAVVTVHAGQQIVRTRAQIPHQRGSRQYIVRLPYDAGQRPRMLDLAFLIDTTGSMGDELRYVNREVVSIVRRVRATVPNVSVRVGGVFYRDRQDQTPLQRLGFSTDVQRFSRAMTRIHASGGGDYPEDLEAGLQQAMRGLSWRQGNAVRVLVVIADAPPQRYSDARYRYGDAMRDAAARGIRLLPVAASGANRTVEYLFRALGAFTATPYTYLTDDSGVGNPHLEADTDRVAVEKFSDLLVRMITSDLRGQGMHEPGAFGPQ